MTLGAWKRRVAEAAARERRESGRLVERWTQTLSRDNGSARWPRDQEPRMTREERDQLRRDLEAANLPISEFLDRLLREGP